MVDLGEYVQYRQGSGGSSELCNVQVRKWVPVYNSETRKARYFKFCVQIVHGKYYRKDILPQMGHCQHHVTIIYILGPAPYIWIG